MKVVTVVGNRPQFIKAAPLSLALAGAGIDEVVVHTGQHYDRLLSEVFFDELGIAEPAVRLDLRSADPALLEPPLAGILRRERPDWTIVLGDTNSTAAGARAAIAARIAVAHVEAGLRSGDLTMPEERNRIEVDQVSRLLLCPDDRSAATLRAEAVEGRIAVVGDVMADAARLFAPLAAARAAGHVPPQPYVLATIHREANVRPDRLARILAGLARLDETVVFPAHPRTRAAIASLGPIELGRIELREPLGYLDLVAIASRARVIVTDSGGLQKEAYWYGVPCVTARPSTEWVDTVAVGANVLVDDDPDRLAEAVRAAHLPDARPALYGDGHAAERIAEALLAGGAAPPDE